VTRVRHETQTEFGTDHQRLRTRTNLTVAHVLLGCGHAATLLVELDQKQRGFRCRNDNVVDLKGQLSNPSRRVGSLAGQWSRACAHVDGSPPTADSRPRHGPRSSPSEEKGRLSNPVQRRITDAEIDDLVTRYETGSTIKELAREFGIHRTTVMGHLERRAIPRRSPRKLTNQIVGQSAHRYSSGETLAEIAEHLNVAPSTLTRELRLAGIPIKRRGRPGRH
jgi:AraC-like DNA-binding protein